MTTISQSQVSTFISSRLLHGRQISADEDLLLSGLLDSLGVMTLVSHLESLRGHAIPPQDVTIENFTSVATITTYLNDP